MVVIHRPHRLGPKRVSWGFIADVANTHKDINTCLIGAVATVVVVWESDAGRGGHIHQVFP